MNMTSLTLEGELQSKRICDKYKSYLDELYKLCIELEKRVRKLKIIGTYTNYVTTSDFGTTREKVLIKNLSDGVVWRGYAVLYIPSDVSDFSIKSISDKMDYEKVIILGFGKLTDLELNNIKSFDGVRKLIVACDLSELGTLNETFCKKEDIQNIVVYGSIYNQSHELTPKLTPKSLVSTFVKCKSLKRVILLDTDFSKLEIMCNTFNECQDLKSIYFDGFKECHLSSIVSCFCGCKSLEELYLRGIHTTDITTMSVVFGGCTRLREIDLSTITIDNVVDFISTFENCKSLERINIGHWRFKEGVSTINMFNGCNKLRSTGNLKLDMRLKLDRAKKAIYKII